MYSFSYFAVVHFFFLNLRASCRLLPVYHYIEFPIQPGFPCRRASSSPGPSHGWETTSISCQPLICWCLVAQSCPTLCDLIGSSLPGFSVHGIYFPGKNIGVGCHFFLQGIFPTQGPICISCISCIGSRILYHWATSGFHRRNKIWEGSFFFFF